jgi:hypothetical protein
MKSALRPSFSIKEFFGAAQAGAAAVSLGPEVARNAARLAQVEARAMEGSFRNMMSFAALLRQVPTDGVEPLEVFGDDRGLAKDMPAVQWTRQGLQLQEGLMLPVPIEIKAQ